MTSPVGAARVYTAISSLETRLVGTSGVCVVRKDTPARLIHARPAGRQAGMAAKRSDDYFQILTSAEPVQGVPSGPYAEQRTVADMVRNMRPVTMTQAMRLNQARRFYEAQQHMLRADTQRVLGFRELKSPF